MAVELFGDVLESYSMETDELLDIMKNTDDKVMFSLENGAVIIAGDLRKPLSPQNVLIPQEKVLRVFSKIRVLELIALGRQDETSINLREKALTLENGNTVLEKGIPCPPNCDNNVVSK